jgi:hypothetical protein
LYFPSFIFGWIVLAISPEQEIRSLPPHRSNVFSTNNVKSVSSEAHGGFTIWLDPFGVLDPQVVVDLLPAPGVVDERSCLKRTKWPSEGLPKGGTQVLAVCVTPGPPSQRASQQRNRLCEILQPVT